MHLVSGHSLGFHKCLLYPVLDVSFAKAAELMVRNKIGCLVVLEGEALVGMITESDILRAVADKEAVFEVLLSRGKE